MSMTAVRLVFILGGTWWVWVPMIVAVIKDL